MIRSLRSRSILSTNRRLGLSTALLLAKGPKRVINKYGEQKIIHAYINYEFLFDIHEIEIKNNLNKVNKYERIYTEDLFKFSFLRKAFIKNGLIGRDAVRCTYEGLCDMM